MRKNNLEISKELRLKMLVASLEGLTGEQMAARFGVSRAAIKARLALLYKYYNVKNQVQLMSLYVKPPTAIYDYIEKFQYTAPKKTYVSHERFKVDDNDSQLPFNKLLNTEKP